MLPAAAQAPLFEAVVSGTRNQCFAGGPAPARGVQWISPDRYDVVPPGTTEITNIASGDGVRVFGTQDIPGPGFRVVELRPDGTIVPVTAPLLAYEPVAIAVASDGRIFVTAFRPGPPFGTDLLVISAAGVVEATYPLASGDGANLAVAPDNCTVYYSSGGDIARINGCTGAALPNFPAPPDDFTDIFVLPDGRVLLATEQEVALYEANGTLARTIITNFNTTYGLGSSSRVAEVAVSEDLQTLYVVNSVNCNFASNATLLRLSFATGAELSRRAIDFHGVSDLVVGGPAEPATAEAIPTASETMLLLLVVGLAVAGALYSRL